MKFKIGDRVRIVNAIFYTGEKIDPTHEWKESMKKIHTIVGTKSDPAIGKKFRYSLKGLACLFCAEELRPVGPKDPKFNVGDKVTVRKDLILDKVYGFGINACNYFGPMAGLRGKEVEIKFVEDKTYRVYDAHGRGWWINEQMIAKR